MSVLALLGKLLDVLGSVSRAAPDRQAQDLRPAPVRVRRRPARRR